MGISGKYYKFPKVPQSGLVYGYDFNKAMDAIHDLIRFYQNMGGYIVDQTLKVGAFPSFQEAFDQAKQEVPLGDPIVLMPVPNQEYLDDLVIEQAAAEDHDVYLINPFEDYTDNDSSILFKGDITLPEIHRWPSGRRKMFNVFGFGLDGVQLNMNSGWDVNMRRCQARDMYFYRVHQSEGAKLWAHDVVFQGSLMLRDYDTNGVEFIFSHCALPLNDMAGIPFKLRGNYWASIIECLVTLWAGTGAGFFDAAPVPIAAGFSGHLQLYGNDIQVSGSGGGGRTPLLVKNGTVGGCYLDWFGKNVITHNSGGASNWDFGRVNGHTGWPECQLASVATSLPLNPPNGCRAIDFSSAYAMKYWDGAAWR